MVLQIRTMLREVRIAMMLYNIKNKYEREKSYWLFNCIIVSLWNDFPWYNIYYF